MWTSWNQNSKLNHTNVMMLVLFKGANIQDTKMDKTSTLNSNRTCLNYQLDFRASLFCNKWCTFGMFCVCSSYATFAQWSMDRKTIFAMYTSHNNCICMFTTKRKTKIAKLPSVGQTHKITLLTDTQNILKYSNICDYQYTQYVSYQGLKEVANIQSNALLHVHVHPYFTLTHTFEQSMWASFMNHM